MPSAARIRRGASREIPVILEVIEDIPAGIDSQ